MKIQIILRAATFSVAMILSGCAYYVPAAYPAAPPPRFDRSFTAASGAMSDQGLSIRNEDRAAGTIIGTSGGATITANVLQQADGSVRVQFEASGTRDPALIDRVSRSYDIRMGR